MTTKKQKNDYKTLYEELLKMAYGGTAIKLQTPADVIAQSNINYAKGLDAYNNAGNGWQTAGNIMTSLGNSVGKAYGVNMEGISGLSHNVMNSDDTTGAFLTGLADVGGDYLTKKLSNQKMATGGFVGGDNGDERDEEGYYVPKINYSGIPRPIKVKGYNQKGKTKYYVFQDYDDPNAMPVGNVGRNDYLKTLRKNNPNMEFIDGDKEHRKLYNDTNWDYEDRYNAPITADDTGVWFSGRKGGDERFFQRKQKSTRSGQGSDNYGAVRDSGYNIQDFQISPEEAKRRERFYQKRKQSENYSSSDDETFIQAVNNQKMAYGGVPDNGEPYNPLFRYNNLNGNYKTRSKGNEVYFYADAPGYTPQRYREAFNNFVRDNQREGLRIIDGSTPAGQKVLKEGVGYVTEFVNPKGVWAEYDDKVDYYKNEIGDKYGMPDHFGDSKYKRAEQLKKAGGKPKNHGLKVNEKFFEKQEQMTEDFNDALYQYMQSNKKAYGGYADGVPIEAEGQELIETPDGMVSEIMGASHENGGVNMVVPENSKIYSKRLKGVDGKSMAKRKEYREKHLAKLQRLVELHPNDKVLKKTLEKTAKDFARQDEEDLMYMQHKNDSQDFLNEIINANFTNPEVAGSYADGGFVNYKGNKKYDPSIFNGYFNISGNKGVIDFNDKNQIKAWQQQIGVKPDGVWGPETFNKTARLFNRKVGDLKTPSIVPNNPVLTGTLPDGTPLSQEVIAGQNTPYFNLRDTINDSLGNTWRYDIGSGKEINKPTGNGIGGTLKDVLGGIGDYYKKSNTSFGDLIGLYGTYKSGVDPMKLTLEQRAGDTPNINPYEGYGERGLDQMQEVKNNLGNVLAQNRQNNYANANASRANANANARGLNTLRAMNLAIDSGLNQADAQAYSQYAQQLAGVDSAIAQMLDRQDQMVMQGDYQRDLADRQDRDNFYTQLQRDTNTRNQMYQQMGKQLNNMKEKDFNMRNINQLTRFEIDANGNLSAKAGVSYTPEELSAMQKGLTESQYVNFSKLVENGTLVFDNNTMTYYDVATGKEVDNNGKVLEGGRQIKIN